MRRSEEDQGARAVRYLAGVILGGAAALVVCFLFLLAMSICISQGMAGMELMYQLTLVGCVVGAFAGGAWPCAAAARGRWWRDWGRGWCSFCSS